MQNQYSFSSPPRITIRPRPRHRPSAAPATEPNRQRLIIGKYNTETSLIKSSLYKIHNVFSYPIRHDLEKLSDVVQANAQQVFIITRASLCKRGYFGDRKDKIRLNAPSLIRYLWYTLAKRLTKYFFPQNKPFDLHTDFDQERERPLEGLIFCIKFIY